MLAPGLRMPEETSVQKSLEVAVIESANCRTVTVQKLQADL